MADSQSTRVFYAGYLRVFGSVGSHPQFQHLQNPPDGYEFIPAGPVELRSLIGVAGGMLRMLALSFRRGVGVGKAVRFIRTRGIRSQLQVPAGTALAFLPTFPFILGQIPWVIEIEDTTTLFSPFILNGQTSSGELAETPYFALIKALLKSDSCRGIVCHVKSAADSIPVLFRNEALRAKVHHVPVGIRPPNPLPARKRSQGEPVTILFTNSWHQDANNFYLRGGLDVLEAFAVVSARFPSARLILRTRLPADLDRRYVKLIAENWQIKVIDQFLPDELLHSLLAGADIFVLPAARIHVVSILQAMAYGMAVVVSDGWGIDEYVADGRNALVVPGRYGKCAWMDNNGMLRENYKSLWQSDPAVVDRLVEQLSKLIETPALREQLGQTARKDVETQFTIEQWNRGLKKAFDQALKN